MRFMAIIAFCLIAMTAMVKEVESEKDKKEIKTTKHESTPIEIVRQLSSPQILEQDLQPTPAPVNRQQRPALKKSQTVDSTEPLRLRFESDKIFILLIASGKLKLFAKVHAEFFKMDRNFHITPSNPTGELYEVLAESIPSRIKRVFENTGPARTYLVALPERSRKALRGFLGTNNTPATGALVIRGDGSIVHEN